MAKLSDIRKAALLAPLVILAFLSACTFDGGVPQPTATRTPQPTGTVSPQPTPAVTPQPTATPCLPEHGCYSPGDQGPAPAGGTRTGAGGTAQGINLGLVVLGGVIVTAGAGLILHRRLRA